MPKRFYVYRLFDRDVTVYVGKGSGNRLRAQMARFRYGGEILRHCATENEAFSEERRFIAELMPTENRCPGGNGGRVKRRAPRKTKLEKQIEAIGTRAFAARILLWVKEVGPQFYPWDDDAEIIGIASLRTV